MSVKGLKAVLFISDGKFLGRKTDRKQETLQKEDIANVVETLIFGETRSQ